MPNNLEALQNISAECRSLVALSRKRGGLLWFSERGGLTFVGGAAAVTQHTRISARDSAPRLQRVMEVRQRERDGEGGRVGSKKESDQVGCV